MLMYDHSHLRTRLAATLNELGAESAIVEAVFKGDAADNEAVPVADGKFMVRLRGPKQAPSIYEIGSSVSAGELWPENKFEEWFVKHFGKGVGLSRTSFRLVSFHRGDEQHVFPQGEREIPAATDFDGDETLPEAHDLREAQYFGTKEGVEYDSLEDMLANVVKFFKALPAPESEDELYKYATLRVVTDADQEPIEIKLFAPKSSSARVVFFQSAYDDARVSVFDISKMKRTLRRLGLHEGGDPRFLLSAAE